MALHCLVEHFYRNSIKLGEIAAEHYLLAAQDMD